MRDARDVVGGHGVLSCRVSGLMDVHCNHVGLRTALDGGALEYL